MLRKLVLIAAAASMAVVTHGALAGAASETPEAAVITVLLAHTTDFTTLDIGAPGPSAGDTVFRKEDLTNPSGAKVGVENTQCTSLTPSDPSTELDQMCLGAITLTGEGQIETQVLEVVTAPPPPPRGPRDPAEAGRPAAILGGSGAFRSARGQVMVENLFNGDSKLHIFLTN